MPRRIGIGLLWAVPAYIAGAFGGGVLIATLSSNTHDLSLEAAMTGAFVTGPIAALIALPQASSGRAGHAGRPGPRSRIP